jgi:hypothetical protein
VGAPSVTDLAAAQTAESPATGRWRTVRWVLLGVVVIGVIAVVSTYLTAPRPGGPMDAESTSPSGAHALVTLLRDRGVDVVVANSVADVEKAARPDSLLLVAGSYYLVDDRLVVRLALVPGDRLLVQPVSITRKALAPYIKTRSGDIFGGGEPDCDLPEATRAGSVQLRATDAYEGVREQPLTSCYQGAVVRYRDGDRTVTVLGSPDLMMNGGLLKEGNAALAMNLAGARPRLIWYAPQTFEGEKSSATKITDLIPKNVEWIFWQLCIVVLLVALWRIRRLGPLVAERLPVVVRASETVEGRGRLYRSRRASDRAAEALRTAALQRMMPRLGLGADAAPPAVVAALAGRCDKSPEQLQYTFFGPGPASDADLVNLAHTLDDIERQVTNS